MVHPFLQMWMPSNFNLYNMIHSMVGQDSSECLMMLIEVINKGSVPYCGSNNNDFTEVSLSKILFSFMLENTSSAMHVD